MLSCVLYYLGAFVTVWLPYETRLQRMHPIHPIDPKTDVLVRSYDLGAFGTVWLPYETRAKRAELVQKFVPRSYVEIFLNERTQSTPLDRELMFLCVA